MRTYSELSELSSYFERFEYLKLSGMVGSDTFGLERWMNQKFYRSKEWKLTRIRVIARDLGCDLGVQGHDIMKQIYVHHMNPMVPRDLHDFNNDVLNPEYLISVSLDTHNAIHYGTDAPEPISFAERVPGDTKLW